MKKSKGELTFGMSLWIFILGIIFIVAGAMTPKTSPVSRQGIIVGIILIIIAVLLFFLARHIFRKEQDHEA